MNKEQLQEWGLDDDQVAKVLEAVKGWVPSSRFNEINEAKKSAEAQLKERDQQLAEFKKTVDSSGDLNAQIEALMAENAATKERYEKELQAYKVSNALELALTQHGAKNIKAAKALMDLDKIKVNGDNVEGIEEQIKELMKHEESAFLFNTSEPKAEAPKGMRAAESEPVKDNKPLTLYDAIAQRFGQ